MESLLRMLWLPILVVLLQLGFYLIAFWRRRKQALLSGGLLRYLQIGHFILAFLLLTSLYLALNDWYYRGRYTSLFVVWTCWLSGMGLYALGGKNLRGWVKYYFRFVFYLPLATWVLGCIPLLGWILVLVEYGYLANCTLPLVYEEGRYRLEKGPSAFIEDVGMPHLYVRTGLLERHYRIRKDAVSDDFYGIDSAKIQEIGLRKVRVTIYDRYDGTATIDVPLRSLWQDLAD